MSSTMELILPAIQELEDEYGDMSKVPTDNVQLLKIQSKLVAQSSMEIPNKKRSYKIVTLNDIDAYIKQTNCTVRVASSHFGVYTETVRRTYLNNGRPVPKVYKIKVSKGLKVYFAFRLLEVAKFLKVSCDNISYAKNSNHEIKGWSIEPCEMSTLNVPKINRLAN